MSTALESADTAPLALARRLGELTGIVGALPAAIFTARGPGGVSGSIGEHVRHCLDHVSAWIGARSGHTLTYDARHRGTTVETDTIRAVQELAAHVFALEQWRGSLDEPIQVSSLLAPGGRPCISWSTMGRELAFVISHTVHHQAVIAVLLAMQDVAVPERFGYAASTPSRH
ncbi:MAG: DinB family protein [Vicinamibacterales bacterium]